MVKTIQTANSLVEDLNSGKRSKGLLLTERQEENSVQKLIQVEVLQQNLIWVREELENGLNSLRFCLHTHSHRVDALRAFFCSEGKIRRCKNRLGGRSSKLDSLTLC